MGIIINELIISILPTPTIPRVAHGNSLKSITYFSRTDFLKIYGTSLEGVSLFFIDTI